MAVRNVGVEVAHEYFYDLPVYRLSYEKYNSMLDAEIEAKLEEIKRISGHVPSLDLQDRMRQHQYERLGPWQFNEAIGQIRLYFLGSQVRGEFFSAERKRNSTGRTKVFTFRTLKLASETDIFPTKQTSSADVWDSIQAYVAKCKKELKKGRVIDDHRLLTLGPHVDWLSVLGWKFQKEGN